MVFSKADVIVNSVALVKVLPLSVSRFSHLRTGDKNNPYSTEWL